MAAGLLHPAISPGVRRVSGPLPLHPASGPKRPISIPNDEDTLRSLPFVDSRTASPRPLPSCRYQPFYRTPRRCYLRLRGSSRASLPSRHGVSSSPQREPEFGARYHLDCESQVSPHHQPASWSIPGELHPILPSAQYYAPLTALPGQRTDRFIPLAGGPGASPASSAFRSLDLAANRSIFVASCARFSHHLPVDDIASNYSTSTLVHRHPTAPTPASPRKDPRLFLLPTFMYSGAVADCCSVSLRGFYKPGRRYRHHPPQANPAWLLLFTSDALGFMTASRVSGLRLCHHSA